MQNLQFVLGIVVGVASVGVACAAFGKWMLKAIVKEVVEEMSGNWVSADAGKAMTDRLHRLEETQQMLLKAHLKSAGEM